MLSISVVCLSIVEDFLQFETKKIFAFRQYAIDASIQIEWRGLCNKLLKSNLKDLFPNFRDRDDTSRLFRFFSICNSY